jgi:uroporphyrinogen-III synthase
MIGFEIVADSIDFEGYDTLMFTSKQAVRSADAIDKEWRRYPAIAIGEATAGEISRLGGTVLYRPEEFYAENLCEDIVRLFSEREVLYLRPEKVSFDSRGHLASRGIEIGERIIYRTSCIKYRGDEAPEDGAIIVFTSPSTIHCFLENFGWRESYTAVVIGRATLEHLPENASFVVAQRPMIDSCIEAAEAFRKNIR